MAKKWWEGGKRKVGDYFKPGQQLQPLCGGDVVTVAEVMVCWQGLRYRMTNGKIHLEFNLRPVAGAGGKAKA